MKKILILNFCLCFLTISCQEKIQSVKKNKIEVLNTNNIIPNLDIKTMKELLDKEYSNIDGNRPSNETSINWLNSEIFKALVNTGYKEPAIEEYQNKIQKIFAINLNVKESCKWNKEKNKYIILYGKKFIKNEKLGINKNILRAEFYEFDTTDNIFFMLQNRFMSFVISPVRIVNFSSDSISYKVKIPQEIISRNKYLFNDDKSQFSWLTTNDHEFMRSLVTTFGYTEDKKLLNWVIKNTDLDFYKLKSRGIQNYIEFGSLFWNKDCNGKLKLHSNTFKIFQELYKPNDDSDMRFLLDNIKEYLGYLFDENNYKDTLTEEDKINIGANLVYFAEQYKYNPEYKDSDRMMGRFRYFIVDDSKGILKKNNYYNLPRFKEWWDKSEYDKDFVIECEYGGTCGRDNPEPDPTDPKYKNPQL